MSTGPKRIQLRRTKGWRMPANTVKVARPTRWGNPFYVGYPIHVEDAVQLYRDLIVDRVAWIAEPDTEFGPGARHRWTSGYTPGGMDNVEPPTIDEIREHLRGNDLACYCPLDQPCHADVLLELANPNTTTPART